MDFLYGNKTQYADVYKSSNSFATGQRLFKIWKDSLGVFEPGDEYILVDEFARELRLQEWYVWRTDVDLALADEDRPQGTTNPELLREKDPASMWYLLGALERYDKMSLEEVREVAFEIAMIGINGLDYASSEKKYTLRSLTGERFSGLQLMCLMYVGFKITAPTQDTGMDLQEPYEMALKLFKPKNLREDE